MARSLVRGNQPERKQTSDICRAAWSVSLNCEDSYIESTYQLCLYTCIVSCPSYSSHYLPPTLYSVYNFLVERALE